MGSVTCHQWTIWHPEAERIPQIVPETVYKRRFREQKLDFFQRSCNTEAAQEELQNL